MDADALEFARALISPRASEELGERAAADPAVQLYIAAA
jgi:hypothetical protein